MESTIPERRYDLDWMRAIAIVILLLFHSGMLFNTWGWHIKNSETSVAFNYWMVWSHFTRMPLLLFISGAGTVLAFRKRKTQAYIGERARRLLVPLLFGCFLIVPPQIYFEHYADYRSYGEFYQTVFEFVPYPEGSFSWHHLWFILYLFLYSLICIPVVLALRKPTIANKLTSIFATLTGVVLIPWILIVIPQVLLGDAFPDETHDLINDWAFFTFYGTFFLFGIILYSLPTAWNKLADLRHKLLAVSGVMLILFYTVYLSFREEIQLPVDSETAEDMFDGFAFLGSWVWVITLVAFAQKWLNRPWKYLPYINEGLYPFYILHQTVIIAVGFYIIQWPLTIGTKYLLVVLATAIICIGLYLALIRPFNFMRTIFGMKPKS